METLLSLSVGIGLSAACGFRIFLPMFVLSLASLSGHVTLMESFAWMGTPAAAIAFGTATFLEIGAYYLPWLDNLLDGVATPGAFVAGVIMTGSMATDLSPFLHWTAAVIAGGGIAGVVQAGTVMLRGVSLGTTGGLANPVLATAELGGSMLMSLAAVFLPVLAIVLLIGFAGLAYRKFRQRKIPAAEALTYAKCE